MQQKISDEIVVMISVNSITPDCANLGLVKLVKYRRVTTGGFVEYSGSNRSLQKIQVVFVGARI